MMYITFASAFLLSSVAAYYSIVGLTTIFMGAFFPIVIMGVALELAKLVTASWLYQHWKMASWYLRTYLIAAVLMLIMITSMGIFGFLAKSHIDSTQDNKSNSTEIETIIAEEKITNTRLNYLLARAETLARSDNTEIASNRIEREIKETQKQLIKLNQIKSSLLRDENKLIANIGPILYIAEMFYTDPQTSVDKSVRLVIAAIMFVFDPLAVLLVIAGNILLAEKRRRNPPPIVSTPPLAPSSAPAPAANTPTAPAVIAATAAPPVVAPVVAPIVAAVVPAVVPSVTPPTPSPASTEPKVAVVPPAVTPPVAVAPTVAAAPAPLAAPATTAAPENTAEIEKQMRTNLMTANDVIAAYKLFYDRTPTAQDNLSAYQNMSSKQLLEVFYSSDEFLARPGAKNLIVSAAKKIQELKTKP
jgi:hypothetical protein